MNVLLLEDSSEDARIIERELQMLEGELVFRCVASEPALDEALDETHWDVILFDYVLPGSTWQEALSRVRARDAFVPFIVVSGKRGEEFVVETVRGGCDDYIVKDRLVRLVPAIERQLTVAKERRQAHQLRERMDRQLARAARAEAVGTLAAGLAHNLNNLLTVTLAGLEAMPKDAGAEASEPLTDAIRSTERASEILRELLRLGQERGEERHPFPLDSMLERVSGVLGQTLPPGIELETRCPPGLTVCGDEASLEQALVNLALNAREAVSRPGRIVLIAETFTVDEGSDGPMPPGRYVRLGVEDDGEGIEPDLVDRVFDPFFTTRGQEGTGLGLATVAACARAHGGWAEVESELGLGSAFSVVFPLEGA